MAKRAAQGPLLPGFEPEAGIAAVRGCARRAVHARRVVRR